LSKINVSFGEFHPMRGLEEQSLLNPPTALLQSIDQSHPGAPSMLLSQSRRGAAVPSTLMAVGEALSRRS
jgi:hypothetical protein